MIYDMGDGQEGDGWITKSYTRVVPARFQTDNDDTFMRSMIMNYALELKTKDGDPTG